MLIQWLLSLTLAQFRLASVRCRNAADHGLPRDELDSAITSKNYPVIHYDVGAETKRKEMMAAGRMHRKRSMDWRDFLCESGPISSHQWLHHHDDQNCLRGSDFTHHSSLMIAALDVSHEATTALILTIPGPTRTTRVASQVDLAQKGSP